MPVTVSPGIALVLVPDFVYFHTMAEIKALADSYQLSCVDQMKEQLGKQGKCSHCLTVITSKCLTCLVRTTGNKSSGMGFQEISV